jgi:hypothetical protein
MGTQWVHNGYNWGWVLIPIPVMRFAPSGRAAESAAGTAAEQDRRRPDVDEPLDLVVQKSRSSEDAARGYGAGRCRGALGQRTSVLPVSAD